MVDNTVNVELAVSNEEEFRGTLSGLEDHVRRVREELQALNEELERAGELSGDTFDTDRFAEVLTCELGVPSFAQNTDVDDDTSSGNLSSYQIDQPE